MAVFPVISQLPRIYREGIGSVVFEWALLENSLSEITYYLLNVGPKHDRVAVRSPRATDQLHMIVQLMLLDGVVVKNVGIPKLR